MSSSEYSEKRGFTRFEVSIPVNYFSHEESEPTYFGATRDISAIGLGLLADKKADPGVTLDICLRVPDGEYIKLQGKVVWTTMAENGKYRIGIELEGENIKPVPILLKVVRAQNNGF